MLLLGRVPTRWYDGKYLEAVCQQSPQFCGTSTSDYGGAGANLAVSAQEYHSLLLQQPDCWESELYQGVAPQATDSAVYTGGMGTDMVDKEEGKIDVDRANESAG